MTKTDTTYREKGRAVFLAAIMVLSMVALSATFAAPAAAASTPDTAQTGVATFQDEEITVGNVTAATTTNQSITINATNSTTDGTVGEDVLLLDVSNATALGIEVNLDDSEVSNTGSNLDAEINDTAAPTATDLDAGIIGIDVNFQNDGTDDNDIDLDLNLTTPNAQVDDIVYSVSDGQDGDSATDSFFHVAASTSTIDDVDTTAGEEETTIQIDHSDRDSISNLNLTITDETGEETVDLLADTGGSISDVQDSEPDNTTAVVDLSRSSGDAYQVGTVDVFAAANASDDGSHFLGTLDEDNTQLVDSFDIDGLQVVDYELPRVAAHETDQDAEITVNNTGANQVTQTVNFTVSDNVTVSDNLDLQNTDTFNQNFSGSATVDPGEEELVVIQFGTEELAGASPTGVSRYETAGFTDGSPFSALEQDLLVGSDEEGSLVINVEDGQNNRVTDATVQLRLTDQLDGDPVTDPIEVNDDGQVTFTGLATGTSDTNQLDYTATAEPDSEDFGSSSTTRGLWAPGQTSDESTITVTSNLEPEAFGVGAFDSENEEIIGDTSTLFANGEFTNQGEFAVFAQTQSANEDNQPVNEDVEVTLAVENDAADDPLRFVDPDNVGENATEITVTIDPDSPTANVDNNDTTGVYSYETFEVTADNADDDTLEDPISTEAFNGTTTDIGTRTIDTDPDVVATSVSTIAAPGGEELQNFVQFVLEGDEVITGDVRDGVTQEDLNGIEIWVAYDDLEDQSYDFVSSTFVTEDGEGFLNVTSSDGSYTISGLAGTNEDFNVYAYSPDNDQYNRLNVSGEAADGPITNGAIAHQQSQTTGETSGDVVTHDIPLFEEEVDFEYQLDVTVEDDDGEQAKSVDVPQQGERLVEVAVEQAPIDQPGDFSPADDGQEVTLDLEGNPDNPDGVGALNDTTLTTSNGTVETTFEAFSAGSGIVNVTAETDNDDGTVAETDASEQAQIEVFGTAEITGDVVDEDGENLAFVDVRLYETADTTVDPVEATQTGSQGSFTFASIDGEPIRTGTTYIVEAEDADGNTATREYADLTAGTNDGDIVIVGGVPGEDPDDGDTDLSRFDTNNNGEIEFEEVIDAINAFNNNNQIGGEDVEFDDVLAVIDAFNNDTPV